MAPSSPSSRPILDAPVSTHPEAVVPPPVDLVSQPAGSSLSDESRIAEANRRWSILEAVAHAMAEQPGLTERGACLQVGVDQATFGRWRRAYEASGFSGLVPATGRRGRRSAALAAGLTPEIARQIQALALDTGSVTAAARLFAQSDRCPEAVADVILDPTRTSKHSIPPSIRQAVRVNPNLEKAHRGRRALDLGGMWIPRRVDILPGDIFTSDDTTPIWAWWVPWVKCDEYPHGVKLLQGQFLPVMDVASQAIVSFVLIAREKASYRAADIWHLFGHTFDTIGLPRLGWQLERGSWEANVIRGQEVEYSEGDLTYSRRVGGLRQLPTQVTDWHREKHGADFAFPRTLQTFTSFLPKSKSIEAFFNRSQSLEGTLWGCLGRDQMRAPNEKAKKIYEACKRPGGPDPREHFLSHLEITNRLRDMLAYLNSEPMEGEVFRGIPSQIWSEGVAQRPLFRLPEEQRWLYRRDWKVVRITNGWARVRLTDEMTSQRYSLFYTAPETFAQLEGQDVVVYYDRENFEQPAQILLAKTGQYLCSADYFERRGSFLEGDTTGHDVRKAWRNAVMSTYGTIAQHAPSRTVPVEIQARRQEGEVRREKREETPAPAHLRGAALTPRLTPAHERAMAEPDDFTALGETRAAEPTAPRPYAVGMAELEEL